MSGKALRPLKLVAILGLVAVVVGAQAPSPKPADKITAGFVVHILERDHMAKPKIDDETAQKWCKNFFKDLDPQKVYFFKNDVAEFSAQATTLDDKIREGNLDFARQVLDRFLKRSDERLATVLELLKQKPDFSINEDYNEDPDTYDYPADAAEAKERWRKRVKLEL